MNVLDRVRTFRWLKFVVTITATGGVMILAALTIAAMTASGSRWHTLATDGGTTAVFVTIAGTVLSLTRRTRRWLAGDNSPLTASESLKRQVIDSEEQVRVALLNGLAPANLAYAGTGPDTGPAAVSVGRKAAPTAVERIWDTLLRFRKDDVGTSQDGALTGIGAYYREMYAQGDTRLLILGKPGSGKTVLAIELILQLLQDSSGSATLTGPGEKIPVRFSVASWTTGTDVRQWLTQQLIAVYQIPGPMAKELIAGRKVLPVLDGLDEMDIDPGDDVNAPTRPAPPRATAFLTALNSYADLNQPAPVVTTCRQDAYTRLRGAGAMLGTYRGITIRDLDAARIASYLHTRYPDPAHPQRRGWDQVLRWLDQPRGAAALRVLSTPWRLLLAISAVEDGQEPTRLLAAAAGESPGAAAERIDRDLLASYVPAATRLTVRRRGSGVRRPYDPVEVTRWMRSLAQHLQWQARQVTQERNPPPGMSAIDMVPHLLWPIGGRRLVRALHAALAFLIITAAMVGALWLESRRSVGARNVFDSLSEPGSHWGPIACAAYQCLFRKGLACS